MDLRVEIVSKDTIKPSSPTPVDLRNYTLTFIDQLAARFYVPIVLLYSTKSASLSQDRLKKSLSVTLTQMYPLAGRLKGQFLIECNDKGADYIHARVDENISRVLQRPEINTLKMLLPYDPNLQLPSRDEDQVLLAVQVNEFSCGGTAIGVFMRHVVADASTAATFLKKWAENNTVQPNNSSATIIDKFVFDCTSIFPPQDMAVDLSTSFMNNIEIMGKAVTKRFFFGENDIANLREKSNTFDGKETNGPTRVEAVVAFIWSNVISIVQARKKTIKSHEIALAVNLRNRIAPPIPPHVMGNYVHPTTARWVASDDGFEGGVIDNKALTQKMRHAIKLVNDANVRKMFANGAMYKAIKERVKLIAREGEEEVGNLAVSSWCRIPFYELDFGWGKPTYVANCVDYINSVMLMDTSDGKGIEVWIGLAEEDMERLVQNFEFLSHCSQSPSVK